MLTGGRGMKRSSGVLMHISSLPNKYGIGSFGKEAYQFVDFLVATSQSYWQILPLTTTGYGDSPYSSYSAFAGNIDFIDLDRLIEEGYIAQEDLVDYTVSDQLDKVDYQLVKQQRRHILEKAVKNFITTYGLEQKDFTDFLEHNKDWLIPFGEFMTLKENFDEDAWFRWPVDYQNKDSESVRSLLEDQKERINYYLVTQYWFSKQWHELKKYANKHYIAIIGDIPIYVAHDSVELWETPELFLVDENKTPTVVSGTPPDGFSADGQYWGNPIYDWDYMEETNYEWWIRRVAESFNLYDYVRLDHFRGFEAYWEIPYNAASAKEGHWVKGPGKKLFKILTKELGDINIIAEDLGYITPEVEELLEFTGYPGMKILQHAFTGYEDSDHMPHHYTKNTIAYVGTHDNETGYGWYLDSTNQAQRDQLDIYLNRHSEEPIADALNRGIAASVSDLVIYTMQDLLMLGNEARMNRPSTIGDNWDWRMKPDAITTDLKEKLLAWTQTYYRMNN